MKTSCLITCYNLRQHIAQCASSCQDFDEILIGFDGCTDGGREEVELWLGSQPFEVHSKYQLYSWENGGPQVNRNRLYEHCSGDIINWMDGDDFRERNLDTLVSQLTSILENRQEGDTLFSIAGLISYCKLWIKDPLYRSEVYSEIIPEWTNIEKFGRIPNFWELMIWRTIQIGGILWTRDCLELILQEKGRIWDESKVVLQEVHLILDAIEMGYSFILSPSISHTYRWGWSQNQVTQARKNLYPGRLGEYYDRLKTFVPVEWVEEAEKWKNICLKGAEKQAKDFEEFGIDPIEPEFD